MMHVFESDIEAKYVKKLKEAGWFITKLMRTSTNGIPDRLCIKKGRVVFIEWKVPGAKTSPLQDYIISKIRDENIEVIIASCFRDIKHLVE